MRPVIIILSGDLLPHFKCHQLNRNLLTGTGMCLSTIHLESQKPPVPNNSNARRKCQGVRLGQASESITDLTLRIDLSPVTFAQRDSRHLATRRLIFEFTLATDLSNATFAQRASKIPTHSRFIFGFTQTNGHSSVTFVGRASTILGDSSRIFEFTLGTFLSGRSPV